MSVEKRIFSGSGAEASSRAPRSRQAAFGRFVLPLALVASATANVAHADEPVNFHDKSITMIVGFPSGGGTDIAARVIAEDLGKHLPGHPTIIVQNMPGAEGVTAMNYFVREPRPDGLTLTMGSASLADPEHYRTPGARYNPTQLGFIAGSGRGGSVLVVNKQAEARLHDKSQKPVIVGSTVGIPRSGMLTAAWGTEFLGWNTKWVIGYPGTSNLLLALSRGEVDMTSSSNIASLQSLLSGGKFEILTQTGESHNGRLEGHAGVGAPVFDELMKGKISVPLQQKSFLYWELLNDMDKWFALPPNTPPKILAAYRKAYEDMEKDPDFLANTKKISDDFEPRTGDEVQRMVSALYATPDASIAFISSMLRREGLSQD
jgi:tripartite-type tricarboxylate transporter receptor subunit TctC